MKSLILLLYLSILAIVLSLHGNPDTMIANSQPINQPSYEWENPWEIEEVEEEEEEEDPWEYPEDLFGRPHRRRHRHCRHHHHHHHHYDHDHDHNHGNNNNSTNGNEDNGNGINNGDGNVGNIGEDNNDHPYDPTFPSLPPVIKPPIAIPPIILSPLPMQPGNNASPNECRISGIYRHMCIPKNILVAAENNKKYKYQFNCYSDAICGYRDGRCQWFATPTFKQCMQEAKFFTIKNGITKNLVVDPATFA